MQTHLTSQQTSEVGLEVGGFRDEETMSRGPQPVAGRATIQTWGSLALESESLTTTARPPDTSLNTENPFYL